MIALLLALAGGLGAMARFSLDSWITSRWRAPLPVGTVIINVTGSLLLGLLTGWALGAAGGEVLAVAGTGFLGGYTTFSTASVEAARLARGGRGLAAVLHAVMMVCLGLGAAVLGLWLTGP
ncbi:fluoride efflux transporter FluC [Tessaracoccus antarcticus]|uniref:Fluoride-specific ion channel FluC n=1 Tax=Tessaracoccus antarcticus TaxID=2479848 RepID=A0A3M0GET7_9ACTN|nr:CrcB family protein [Tessaracoccus antarcticus]RMB61172.1 camphor resistance protein CrcB [Tessaracoccus antarcticus]